MAENSHASYYTDRHPKLMRGFETMFRCAAGPIERVLGDAKTDAQTYAKTDAIHRDARAFFEALIPQLPYIGGGKAPGTKSLVGGARLLAICRALEQQGLETEAIGEVIYRTCERFFKRTPAFLARCAGRMMVSGLFVEKRKKIARESQKREFPEAFVSEVVAQENGAFDHGLDILECAICKFYKKHGAEKYLPYVCLGDYPLFRHLGIGFTRSKTLGNGDDRCDFRFTRGGQTPDGWPPETLPEWKK